jgi:glycine betaine/proline transport system ATP-binding protein
VRQLTKRPLVLLGDSGELIGVVGEHELYRGMLRQTEYTRISKSPEPQPVETP